MIPVLIGGLAIASLTFNAIAAGSAVVQDMESVESMVERCEALDGIDTSMKNMLKKE